MSVSKLAAGGKQYALDLWRRAPTPFAAKAMQPNRRALYRAVTRDQDRLQLRLTTSSGESRAERVLDVSLRGASALFPVKGTAPLGAGDNVTLTFTSPTLTLAIQRDAVVISQVEHKTHRRYGFKFTDEEHLDEGLSGRLYRLFDRRGAYRVRPDPKEPVPVHIHVQDGPSTRHIATALMTSVSATGIDVVAKPGVEASLEHTNSVQLTLELPPASTRLRFAARIRHRTEEWNGVCYGMKLDPNHSSDFERQQRELLKYVSRRHTEAV